MNTRQGGSLRSRSQKAASVVPSRTQPEGNFFLVPPAEGSRSGRWASMRQGGGVLAGASGYGPHLLCGGLSHSAAVCYQLVMASPALGNSHSTCLFCMPTLARAGDKANHLQARAIRRSSCRSGPSSVAAAAPWATNLVVPSTTTRSHDNCQAQRIALFGLWCGILGWPPTCGLHASTCKSFFFAQLCQQVNALAGNWERGLPICSPSAPFRRPNPPVKREHVTRQQVRSNL
jgi:hypothetical protein